MKNYLLLFALIFVFACNEKQNPVVIQANGDITSLEFIDSYNKTFNALNDSNYNEYLKHAKTLYNYAPHDFAMKLIYADALAANEHYDESKKILNEVIALHSHLTYDRLHQNQFIQKLDNYNDLLQQASKDTIAINNSTLAFTIEEKDLIPEGVAFDSKTNTLFVSSIIKRKIIAIDSQGNTTDFIQSGQDDILSVLGMEVDEKRRHLWVCSEWDNPRKIVADSLLYSSVYKYDLESGSLIKKYVLKDTAQRLLNDLTIANDGTVYISESLKGKVYIIRPETDSLELFINPNYFYYANGITISDDNKTLYVSHFTGTEVVDLENNTMNKIKHPKTMNTGRVDGLAFYKNSLIAHQGDIVRYYLNETGDSIIKKEIIERNNPLFEIPTTGEIAGDEYYYIANAQLRKIDNDGFAFPDEQLDSVYILKTNLENHP